MQASEVFCQQPFQTRIVEHGISQKALQLSILGFKVFQAAQLCDLPPAILGLLLIQCRIRHAVLAAKLRDFRPGRILLQDPNNLFFGET